RDMAGRAADLVELPFPQKDHSFDLRITWDHTTRHLERGLPDAYRRHVGSRELVLETIAIRIRIKPETLRGLDAVMLIERVVGELANRNHIARLMPGPDDKAWGSNGGT